MRALSLSLATRRVAHSCVMSSNMPWQEQDMTKVLWLAKGTQSGQMQSRPRGPCAASPVLHEVILKHWMLLSKVRTDLSIPVLPPCPPHTPQAQLVRIRGVRAVAAC